MNKLILNIAINFYHKTKTAERMAEELEQLDLVEVIQASIASNPDAITVGAFRETAIDQIEKLYNNAELNLWLEEDE